MFEIERWGSLSKAMRVVGWVLRFLGNVQSSSENRSAGDLTFPELCKAKVTLLQDVQCREYPEEMESLHNGQTVPKKSPIHKLSPFLGDEDLLRM